MKKRIAFLIFLALLFVGSRYAIIESSDDLCGSQARRVFFWPCANRVAPGNRCAEHVAAERARIDGLLKELKSRWLHSVVLIDG